MSVVSKALLQVDGFRFDIMGHLMLSTMKKIQSALAGLTLDRDGVDGRGLYIYGEAWDFGEVSISTCCIHLSLQNPGSSICGGAILESVEPHVYCL